MSNAKRIRISVRPVDPGRSSFMLALRLPLIVSTRGRPRVGPASRRTLMAATSGSASRCSRAFAQASQLGWNSTDQVPLATVDNNTIIDQPHQVAIGTIRPHGARRYRRTRQRGGRSSSPTVRNWNLAVATGAEPRTSCLLHAIRSPLSAPLSQRYWGAPRRFQWMGSGRNRRSVDSVALPGLRGIGLLIRRFRVRIPRGTN